MSTHRKPQHDGLAIASLVMLFFMPLFAWIFGVVSIYAAHQQGRKASWMAKTAVWGSSIGFAIAVVVMAYVVMQH